MSDHLPECAERRAEWRWSEDCICKQLRACEQRVLAEQQADLDHVAYVLGQTNERQRSAMLIADAYAAGVQAARDAVEVTLLGTLQLTRDRVLAAIDGLLQP